MSQESSVAVVVLINSQIFCSYILIAQIVLFIYLDFNSVTEVSISELLY